MMYWEAQENCLCIRTIIAEYTVLLTIYQICVAPIHVRMEALVSLVGPHSCATALVDLLELLVVQQSVSQITMIFAGE